MPTITFWSDGKDETGKTVSLAAIATFLSIENNYKTLIFNANYNDSTLEDCFWEDDPEKAAFARNKKMVDISEGITGLIKAIASNKASPEIISNYTKSILLKRRLELLTDKNIISEDFKKQRTYFKEIMKIASKSYDLVLTDLNGDIEDPITKSMLEASDLIVVTTSQKLKQIREYMKIKKSSEFLKNKNLILLLGRYDKNSKYTSKNIGRYIGEDTVFYVPYNTLFFEACNEGKVVDYFIKYRKKYPTERNSLFVASVQEASEGIVYFLKETQMKAY